MLCETLAPLNSALTLLSAHAFVTPDGERWFEYVETLHRARERIDSALSCAR